MNNDLMETFNEMYVQFCRLKGYKLPKSPIEQLVDNATGAEEAYMKEFATWIRTEILPRWQFVTTPTPHPTKESK